MDAHSPGRLRRAVRCLYPIAWGIRKGPGAQPSATDATGGPAEPEAGECNRHQSLEPLFRLIRYDKSPGRAGCAASAHHHNRSHPRRFPRISRLRRVKSVNRLPTPSRPYGKARQRSARRLPAVSTARCRVIDWYTFKGIGKVDLDNEGRASAVKEMTCYHGSGNRRFGRAFLWA
jgi:hypothetical protein